MRDLLISFAKVFAAMSPWLVVGFLAAGVMVRGKAQLPRSSSPRPRLVSTRSWRHTR